MRPRHSSTLKAELRRRIAERANLPPDTRTFRERLGAEEKEHTMPSSPKQVTPQRRSTADDGLIAPKAETFEPKNYLIKVKGGRDYLEVKWRLYWLRLEHKEARIEAELVQVGTDKTTGFPQWAIFRVVVSIKQGDEWASATGHAKQQVGDFGDWFEKGETKALGRALAALGYGTQFVGDELDEGVRKDGEMALADSPIGGPKTGSNAPTSSSTPVQQVDRPAGPQGALQDDPADASPAATPTPIRPLDAAPAKAASVAPVAGKLNPRPKATGKMWKGSEILRDNNGVDCVLKDSERGPFYMTIQACSAHKGNDGLPKHWTSRVDENNQLTPWRHANPTCTKPGK